MEDAHPRGGPQGWAGLTRRKVRGQGLSSGQITGISRKSRVVPGMLEFRGEDDKDKHEGEGGFLASPALPDW